MSQTKIHEASSSSMYVAERSETSSIERWLPTLPSRKTPQTERRQTQDSSVHEQGPAVEFDVRSERRDRQVVDRGRRVINVVAAVIGLIVAAPLMLVIALAIKLTSRGPVLFTQQRVGLDRRGRRHPSENGRRQHDAGGRVFTIYKFRTMYEGSSTGRQVWARKDDPRITPVGRVLRKTRLDELPQLFNVLKGDMNLVGPRPEQPEIFQELREHVDGYERRQKVLPGITGWAQINHHYDQCIDDVKTKVQLDLQYIDRRSVAKDVLIMARTVPVVVGRKGAH